MVLAEKTTWFPSALDAIVLCSISAVQSSLETRVLPLLTLKINPPINVPTHNMNSNIIHLAKLCVP